MALYPHTITAIAKNTTAGSNIVPGAIVSLLNASGVVVTMYDDAAGSNGSTGKTADTRGQVTVYIEQGEYSLSVNGTANGKFVVAFNKDLTTIDLIASTKIYSVGDTVPTVGFTSAGDGGSGQWIKTVVTGQTPSQTPAQLGDALLNDASGNQWVLIGWNITPEQLGSLSDGVADDYLIFVAVEASGRNVYLSPRVAYNSITPIELTVAVTADEGKDWVSVTDTGSISWKGGRVTTEGANISRLADRVFVGQAASQFAGNSILTPNDAGDSSFSGDDVPSYLAYNGQMNVIAGPSQYAIAASAKGTDLAGAGVIGVGSAIVNDKASGRGWGFIAELQHETGAWVSNGLEVAAKNKSTDNFTYKPYQATFGVFGTRYVAGGDAAFGGAAANPSTAAVVIIKNETSSYGWNTGITFTADSLEGTDGTMGSTGSGTAIAMARTHQITWDAPNNQVGAIITSIVTDSSNLVKMQIADNFVNCVGVNGRQFARFAHATNGVNYLESGSSVTGAAPYISAKGDDTNVDLRLETKGTGVVIVGDHTALAAETVSGYITIKDSAGTLRKLAVIS